MSPLNPAIPYIRISHRGHSAQEGKGPVPGILGGGAFVRRVMGGVLEAMPHLGIAVKFVLYVVPAQFGSDLIDLFRRGVAITIAEEADDGTVDVAQPFERRCPLSP